MSACICNVRLGKATTPSLVAAFEHTILGFDMKKRLLADPRAAAYKNQLTESVMEAGRSVAFGNTWRKAKVSRHSHFCSAPCVMVSARYNLNLYCMRCIVASQKLVFFIALHLHKLCPGSWPVLYAISYAIRLGYFTMRLL